MAAAVRKLPTLSHILLRKSLRTTCMNAYKCSTVTPYKIPQKRTEGISGGKFDEVLNAYEDFVGLTEVREAQEKVIEAEQKFLEFQRLRREKQFLWTTLQNQLKALNLELEKTNRGDEKYLQLLTEEHKVLKKENNLNEELEQNELQEKESFAALSSAVRESHEKERVRTERTKYWSLIGSVIGAAIGIIGTSINNYLRMKELRGIVIESAEGGVQMKGLVKELSHSMSNQHNQIQTFITDLKTMIGSSVVNKSKKPVAPTDKIHVESKGELRESQTTEILSEIKRQDAALENEMKEIKKILATSKAVTGEGNVVYVGPEVEGMIENAERNIEWKLKMNALWTATIVYGAFAITLPILFKFIGGP